MSLILNRSASLSTCTAHEDCNACRELADVCYESTYGRSSGMVEINGWNHEYMSAEEQPVATMFRDGVISYGDRAGEQYRSFDVLTESYVGRVVAIETRSERIMSDMYGEVRYAWCAELDGSFTMRSFGEAGYDQNQSAEVDAPEELIAEWQALMARKEAERRELDRQAAEHRAREREEQEAKTPRNGRTIKVVRGRKVPVGTVGQCIWYGETRYGWRVGIKVSGRDEPYWTAASNVEVVLDGEAVAA